MVPERHDVVLVPLVTRVPRELYRGLRLHCVEAGMHVQTFVTQAIVEALERPRKVPVRSGRRRTSDLTVFRRRPRRPSSG